MLSKCYSYADNDDHSFNLQNIIKNRLHCGKLLLFKVQYRLICVENDEF